MKKRLILLVGVIGLLFSCNEYKKKEIIGTWTPTVATITPQWASAGDVDTMDFPHVLTLKKDKTYDWTGWLSPGTWELNGDNTQISIKTNDETGSMLCKVVANDAHLLELESISGVAGIYHITMTK